MFDTQDVYLFFLFLTTLLEAIGSQSTPPHLGGRSCVRALQFQPRMMSCGYVWITQIASSPKFSWRRGSKDARGQGFKRLFSKDFISAYNILSISEMSFFSVPNSPFSIRSESPANNICVSNSQIEP